MKEAHCCPLKRYRKKIRRMSYCSSKAVFWILVQYGIVTSSTNFMHYSITLLLPSENQRIVLRCVLSGTYILFPILAYLGERFNRYRMMMSGIIVTIISYLFYIIILIMEASIGDNRGKNFLTYTRIVLIAPSVCGTGLYITNIPQFGASQLQFASSEHLAAFTRWVIWTYLTSQLVSDVIDSVLLKYQYQSQIEQLCIVNGLCFSMLLLSSIIIRRLRHSFIIDPPPEIDGLKLIWRVMKYSWKHKNPVRRSAFTYSEGPPTRLDLAKERYGGPFTTKQVEEVKSFWHLIQIPICHFFFTSLYPYDILAYQYTHCQNSAEMNQFSFFEIVLLVNNKVLAEAVAVIGLLSCILFTVSFCQKLIPSILQRIWIGLFFLLLSSLSVMVISFNVTGICNLLSVEQSGSSSNTRDTFWPYYMFIVPEFLSGLGIIFNLTAQLEFILAQAPHSMQSIFIGALYMENVFPYLCNAVGTATLAGRYWYFYVVLSCIQLIITVVFMIIKRRYKYRQCNNYSDINIRRNIEEVYERDLDARDLAAMKGSYQSMSLSIHGITNTSLQL